MNRANTLEHPPAFEFGAILEKVPSGGTQWSTAPTTPVERRSSLSLTSLLLIAMLVAGAWYGWTYWSQQHAPPFSEATAAYVDGTGVDYTSPVTGVGATFAGAPIETQISGAPAAVFSGGEFTMLVAAFDGAVTADTVAAATAPYIVGTVRIGTATVGPTSYAVVVGGADDHAVDAVYARFTDSLRLPGGATI